jgi:hypothetical protein
MRFNYFQGTGYLNYVESEVSSNPCNSWDTFFTSSLDMNVDVVKPIVDLRCVT